MSDFEFDGFEPSNTTPVPDVLFDQLLSELSGAELKVLLYIIRRTRGFKKDTDAISLTQFQKGITTRDGRILDKGCGVKDRTTLVAALVTLEEKNCIQSEKCKTTNGDNDITLYRIHFSQQVVGKSDHPTNESENVVGKTYQGGRKNPKGVVGKTYPQETVLQETVLQETVEGVSLDAENTTPSLFPDLPPETKEIPIATKVPQWSATSCKAMFDEWRGFPLASSRVAKEKAKYLAGNFSREVVVAAHDYMSTNPWWKDRVGGDIAEVSKHMSMIMTQLGISDPKATIIDPKTNVIPFSQGQRKVSGGAPAQNFSESTLTSTEEMLTGLSPYMAKANRMLKAAGLAPIC